MPNFRVNKASLFNGVAVRFKQTDAGIQLTVPGTMPDENDSVIILEINGNAETIPVIKT
jgi:alpha-L-fucosidase